MKAPDKKAKKAEKQTRAEVQIYNSVRARLDSHTAHLFVGSVMQAEALLAEAGITHQSFGADFDIYTSSQITISDVRTLKERASVRPLIHTKKYLLIEMRAITRESQHALLKLLEEPPGATTIIIAVMEPDMLLDTVRSRLQLLPDTRKLIDAGHSSHTKDATDFLNASPGLRMEIVSTLLKEGDKASVRLFVDALHSAYHRYLRTHKNEREAREGMHLLFTVRSYLTDQAPSQKQLLEHLAAALPRVQ